MKIYKQAVLIQKEDGYLEVVSFYDLHAKGYGIDIFFADRLVETIHSMQEEPLRDHMRSIGNNFTIRNNETTEA